MSPARRGLPDADRVPVTPSSVSTLLGLLDALAEVDELVVVRDGDHWVVAAAPDDRVLSSGPASWRALERLAPGWWAGWLSYELGHSVEPVVRRVADDLGLPDLVLARFDARLVLAGSEVRIEGDGPSRPLLERAVRRAATRSGSSRWPPPALGPWTSSMSEAEFRAGVREVVALVEAGECYQVNLTRRLTCHRPADPLSLFAVLVVHHPAPHAALVRLGPVAVVSASPERFLRGEGELVETRPIKGTAADPALLVSSAKDRAENVMIVDLARNDLGRVCRFGSVEVSGLCRLEAHPGLYHLVSTVRGRLRSEVGISELIRANFPPASVTGAPKPRVMQAIEDLEPVRRGVYCGSVGWIDTRRRALDLNVAIRTFTVVGDETHLGVGGGILVDSVPAAEWRETELKASRLLRTAAAGAGPLARLA